METFVKKKRKFTPEEIEILEGVKEGIEEMKLIRAGKLKGIPARDLLNEL